MAKKPQGQPKQENGCDECGEGLPKIPAECVGPASPPWLPLSECLLVFREPRLVREVIQHEEFVIEFLIIIEHCLRLVGRQQGPLVFTTTLLPLEVQKIYHYERHRRAVSVDEAMSVHAEFRSNVGQIHSAGVQWSDSHFEASSKSIQGSFGGGLLGFFGAPSGSASSSSFESASAAAAGQQFEQTVTSASQLTESSRSIVVSLFEDQEALNVTSRELKNPNPCRAVTYYARRVFDVYELHSRIVQVFVRIVLGGRGGEWREVSDQQGLTAAQKAALGKLLEQLKRGPDKYKSDHHILVPTDGLVFDAELTHCGSCDPLREAQVLIEIEKAREEVRRGAAQTALLEAEAERRRKLIDQSKLDPFEPLAPATSTTDT